MMCCTRKLLHFIIDMWTRTSRITSIPLTSQRKDRFTTTILDNAIMCDWTRIKMTDKCLRNYLPEQLNSVPNIVSSKIYTHSLHGFSSAVKRFILVNYSTECTIAMCASSNTVFEVMYAIVKLMYVFFSSMSTIVFEHCFKVCVVFLSPRFVFFLIFLIRSTHIYSLVFPWLFAKSADLFDRDCLITYHFPSTKFITAMISTEN